MADRITKGRDFFAQVAQHLPDDLRAGFETFIASGDQNAQHVLATLGDGTLRQDAFSREMDNLRQTKTALEKWRDDLAQWAKDVQNGVAPADPLAQPGSGTPVTGTPGAAGTPANALTREEALALFNGEMGRREVYFAKYVADATRLATQHFQQFGEVLDINQILAHPKLGELQLQGVYQELHKDKIAAKSAAEVAKEREELKRTLRAEIDAERGAAGVPYPIGDGSSPLDHLGKDASQYTPEAAAAMYRQLVGGGAR